MAKILVVDDSTISRKMALHVVQQCGHDTVEASGGEQALERIASDNPEVIILDLLMPKVDGFAVLQKMKDDEIAIPTLILSADIQRTTRERCSALGVAGFLNKPPQKEDVENAIKNAIEDAA